MKRFHSLLVLTFICFSINAQDQNAITNIINKINDLEKAKDPKCYATANRLEDFMYGTPLDEHARNLKIEIQKELILYLKRNGSKNTLKRKGKAISDEDLKPVISKLSKYIRDEKGDFYYQFGEGYIPIKKKDFRQYASVSYSYRALLSVEQDMFFSSEKNLYPFNNNVIEFVTNYINLITLVTLKIADNSARKQNQTTISKNLIKNSWIEVLNRSNSEKVNLTYPKLVNVKNSNNDYNVIRNIIKQKINSYSEYNNISQPVFLRNIQVYFARQKWPTNKETSTILKNYFIESLVQFSVSLIEEANKEAKENPLIRLHDIQKAARLFLPIYTNTFEDVTFFPNNTKESITIESYDLDAFRDSGIHWNILEYALNDISKKRLKSLDPNAAEFVVENIAQLGVLVLRIAGEYSKNAEKKLLDLNDIENGFKKIQKLINSYSNYKKVDHTTIIASSKVETSSYQPFNEISQQIGIQFEHKSSDWLSRHIRGYTSKTENDVKTVKLAIPPAFGGSGVACEDINNDGFVDILLLSGFGNKLYLNKKNGTFRDITELANINIWNNELNSFAEPRQPVIVDFNNDGFQDILITYVNNTHQLYKNVNGKKLVNVSTQANLGGIGLVAGPATVFDYNNDGLLDIFIGYFGNYLKGDLPTLSRDNQNGTPNKLFKNLGDFQFEEVSFTNNKNIHHGWTQALGHTDLNQDGYQDIIVGNDFGLNKYYLGSASGIFKEQSKSLGTDKPSYTMNVGITDLNKDLMPDLYISNIVVMQKDEKYVAPNETTTMKFDREKMANIRTIEANDLFLSNTKGGKLINYSLSNNIGRGYSSTGWSWDADFFDFDNDGDEDLYCLNGMNDFSVYSSENPFYFERAQDAADVTYAESDREKNVFFVNTNGALTNKAKDLGTDLNSNARSASFLDYDEDGDLDILINNYHDKANFLANNTPKTKNWIKIKLIGNPEKKINRDAIGSSLILNSKSHKNVWREVHSTTGYLSVHPKEQHFGLGNDTKVTITIQWSNGESYNVKELNANHSYSITYPNIVSTKNKEQ